MNGNELNSTTPNKEINSGFMNPKCSCSECDSVDCFVARNTKAPCSCVKCTNSKICFHYSNRVNMNERNSEINIAKKTNSLVNPKNTIKNEYVEKEVIEDLNNNNNTKSSAVSKKQSKNSEIATDRKTDFHFESDKDERPYTHVHSASIKISRTNLNPATADLSAQIMNVPYQDFKNSLSVNKSDNSYKGKMIKYDILTRIKEAYKACSCKVCECVIGKSHTRNEFCKCRPCDCNDCTSLLSKINSVKGGVHFLPVDGCPCIRCSRPQCKGIVNKFNEPQICDCEACDCIKCTTDSFNKLCNCQPCQCVECNAMSIHLPTTFIVAPVGEDYQRNVCQCSPCDCIECGHGYGMSSNLRHEMSTGINIRSFCHCEACVNEACEAEGIDSCKCQRRNKIMMKPVKKDVHDYDIRTISTKEYSWRHNDKKCTTKSDNDTIAMFATLPDQYVAKYDNMKKRSDSEKCKCLDCNCNENAVDSIKSSQLFKAPIFPCLKDEACKCSPCECQVYFDSTIDKETSSKCKVRDCFNCQSLTKTFMCKKCNSGKLINKLSSKGICKNRSGPCVICRKLMHSPGDTLSVQYGSETRECYSNEDIYPIKRAKLLTPSILNGIERENEDSNNESYSSNLDDLLKISEWTLRQLRTNIQNQSHKDISANDIFQKSHSEITAERQLSSNSILVSGVSPETNTSDIKKLNIEVNKDADFLNTDLKKSEASFSELYENIVNVKQTVYERIKMEDNLYSKDRFNSSSIINDFSYNYNATSLSKSITNCNKHINFCVSLNDEESIQADTFNSNAYNQGNINNMYYDRNSTTRNYKLSGASNNIMKNRSRGIILSDPQFNLNRDRHEVVKHVLKYAFKNKNHSMINRGQLVNASVDKDIIFLSLRANFERAQKTLHEAKIYSTNLLKILEKYEKANTEFQSISEKLKLSHDLLKGDSFEFAHVPFTESKTNNKNNINTMANEIEYGAKKQRIRIIDELMDFNLKDLTTLEPVKLEKKDNSRLPTNFVGIPDIKNQKTIHVYLNQNLKRQDIYLTQNNIKTNTYIDSAKSKSFPHYIYLNSHRKKFGRVMCYKSNYSKILRRAIILSKKIRLARKTKTVTTGCTISEITKHISSQTVNSFKNFIDKEDMILNKPITRKIELIENSNKSNKCNIMNLPTKSSISTTCVKIEEREKVIRSSLDVEVKEALHSISLQTDKATDNKTFLSYGNKALKKLQNEVDKLLDIPLLDTVEFSPSDFTKELYLPHTSNWKPEVKDLMNLKRKYPVVKEDRINCTGTSVKTDSRIPIIKSTKSSCDEFKVNFLSTKRVSDHTVLVKWNVPRNTADIQGYELQVDGRAVQKILSPTRNVAVVTCLPHSDKVLLTVRTINSAMTGADHYPTVTVIYNPRKK